MKVKKCPQPGCKRNCLEDVAMCAFCKHKALQKSPYTHRNAPAANPQGKSESKLKQMGNCRQRRKSNPSSEES